MSALTAIPRSKPVRSQATSLIPADAPDNLVAKMQLIEDSQRLLLIVTAPWCGHCKNLLPEIPGIAEALRERFTGVDMVHLTESEITKDFMIAYGIRGFPHISLLSGGEIVAPFKGRERTGKAIVYFAASTGNVK